HHPRPGKMVNGTRRVVRTDPTKLCFNNAYYVIDTGKVIPKDKRVSVFENYVQVKETTPKHEGTCLGLGIETAPEQEGTGLGLGIVQSLVMRYPNLCKFE
nr:histidine kinase CKI1 [Tanacetum cinerariifolium]